jgi:hypothetical protein
MAGILSNQNHSAAEQKRVPAFCRNLALDLQQWLAKIQKAIFAVPSPGGEGQGEGGICFSKINLSSA